MPPNGPHEKDWWWHGDREAPWRKERGFWQNGKYVPLDVANNIQEKLGKEVESLRGQMNKNEIDLQLQLNSMKKQAADADRDRMEALSHIKHLKESMSDGQLADDVKHNY